jgi:predicted dehydrogenase
MERGVAVHCQKPLTQSVWEARLLTKAAEKYRVPTQMGNQGYSHEATRVACEIIWNGDIGDVTEVHSWSGGGFSRGVTTWPPTEDVPKSLNWDLWTGRAAEQPYSSKIHPINWRGFLDYGTQMIGDWGIHMLGPANWALQLGNPTSVECTAVKGANSVTYPSYACKLEFPERPNKYVKSGKMPAVTVYWYEGELAKAVPLPKGLTANDLKGINEIFIGTKGYLGTGGRGESVTLLPRAKMEGYKKPAHVLKRSPGHFQDWIRACKGGDPACSNFSIAGPYTEWMLLGAISWRFPNEKLQWDGKELRFTNNEKANEFVKPKFRKGWELKDITV